MDPIKKVERFLKEQDLAVLIIDEPIDIFYLTGLDLSLGRLVISIEEAILFVDGRYFEKCQRESKIPVELTKGYGKTSGFFSKWKWQSKRIGFDAAVTSYSTYQDFEILDATLIPLKYPIKKIREIKEEKEIEALRESAALAAAGFDHAIDLLQEKVTEREVARELELFWIKSGGDKLSFSPHIAFGPNSAYPHHAPSSLELTREEIVLIDIGVVKDKYHSDMTRTLFFLDASSELEKIYYVVKEAQARAFERCRAGTLIKDLDRAARQYIDEKGYGAFFPHSLGHGIGLEIHEFPFIRADSEGMLEENMVITIEPGIYIPAVGGVRLEDTIVIKKDGFENLTKRPLSAALPLISMNNSHTQKMNKK